MTTIEKPFRVTLPAKGETGLCYIGIRESDTDPWRFMKVGDSNEITAQEYAFNLHRLSTSFCLVGYRDKNIPETVVDSLIASSTAPVLVKDGRYLEDISLKGILKGNRLDSINPTDLMARITYRSNKADEAPIKVNGVNVTQTSKADKTVPGYTYYHSFEVDSFLESNLLGTSGEYTFTLNTSGIEIDSFPTGFLIEFYNRINGENILPYYSSEFFRIDTKEKQEEPEPEPQPAEAYSIAYNLDGGVVTHENPTSYGAASDTFVLYEPTKVGYIFIGWTGSNGDVPQTSVSIVKGSKSDKAYTANYSPITYNITYELNGGVWVTANTEKYDITSATIVLKNPIKEGYTFVGWSGTEIDGIASDVAIIVGSTDNREYTAHWSENPPNTYTLTLNKGDGIATVTGAGSYKAGDEVTATCTMLAGYEFDSWSGDFTTEIISMPANNASMTANAKPITYNIAYSGIGGASFANNNPTSYDITSATITLSNPTKTGYTFLGWSGTDLTGNNNMEVIIPHGSTGIRGYTANWNLNLNLAVSLDDGMLIDNVNKLCYTKSTFTITPDIVDGLILTNSEKEGIIGAISVKDSANNTVNFVSADWNNEGKIALSFNKDLNASSTYSISFGDAEGMTLNCATFTFKTFYYKGRGINDNRYQVENAVQLDLVRNYLSRHFVQTADIDIATYTWSAICGNNSFTGSYYGNGKSIKNLKIRNTDTDSSYSLFGYVENNNTDINSGKIASVTVDGFSIRGSDTDLNEPYSGYVGIIAYEIFENCSIEYCKVTDSLNGNCMVYSNDYDLFGGICHECNSNASIKNCIVENLNFNTNNSNPSISGICSDNYGSIDNCSFVNCIINDGACGGICGYNGGDGSISNCLVDSSCLVGYQVGGICGFNELGTISLCKVINGSLIKGESYTGGICGNNEDQMSQCYISDSSVEAVSDYGDCNIGGISGYSNTISDCYVLNTTIKANCGDDSKVGGICGITSNKMSNSYFYYDKDNNLPITSDNNNVLLGLLSGHNYGGNLSDCFTNKSGILVGQNNGLVASCYDSIDEYTKFTTDSGNPRAWSDGSAWSAYTINDSANWPPNLIDNLRP